jgi:hypothetical protein
MDDGGTTGEAGRWLSYAELAELRGITRKAAARLTLRHRWRRQPGNDGAVRVWVPDADMTHRQTPRHEPTATPPDMTAPLAVIEAALTAANERASAAFAIAERTLSQLADADARADRAEARADDLRTSLDTIQHAMDHANAEAQQAARAADALRAADADRKARGLLTRLRSAWRGE